MKNDLIVGISGLRGIFGKSLTPETILKYTSAFSRYVKDKKIIIGRDGRITGKIISDLVTSTLLSKGNDVIDLGVIPTPSVQVAVEHFAAVGGISITASHNPIEWNGLKFLSKTGMFLDAEENQQFIEISNDPKIEYKEWNKIGTYKYINDFGKIHIEKIIKLEFLDLKGIRNRNFKVVLDCVNASGSVIIPQLLEKFGCEIIKINCELSGIFPHYPEPLPQNLIELSNKVIKVKADFGIAVDPDADRLVLICEDGEPFGEELTITQAVKFILNKKKGKVVTNLSTTRALDDVVKMHNCDLIKTPVGEINVAKKMKEIGAVIGGEGSGGIILPDVHLGRDSLVGIAITLQHLTEFDGTLGQLKQSLPSYVMTKEKFQLESMEKADEILNNIIKKYKDEIINTLDGVRIDYDNSWIIIRKSNTEPIIRIYSEGKTEDSAKSLSDSFINEIKEYM
jgi:phosphomannomutase